MRKRRGILPRLWGVLLVLFWDEVVEEEEEEPVGGVSTHLEIRRRDQRERESTFPKIFAYLSIIIILLLHRAVGELEERESNRKMKIQRGPVDMTPPSKQTGHLLLTLSLSFFLSFSIFLVNLIPSPPSTTTTPSLFHLTFS
ncbi:hypothetical protein ACB094_03G177400 [Castanea mollissima]